jgi:antitoxin (DNA-binding transcriptional repressor) of toxin-antitoxin stability system
MKSVDLSNAKLELSDLIDSGEEVTIMRSGRAVAILRPIRENLTDVTARIRANSCIQATTEEIVAVVRERRG